MMDQDKNTIWIITGEPGATRGGRLKQQNIDELSVSINLFLEQMGNVLEKTPEKIGKFHFEEFEVHAEVTAQGTIAVLGTGLQAGATGGLRFVFRRSSTANNGK
jgi:hypothetical protein